VTDHDSEELAREWMPHVLAAAEDWARRYGYHLREEFESAAVYALAKVIRAYGDRPKGFNRRLNAALRNQLADALKQEMAHQSRRADLPLGLKAKERPWLVMELVDELPEAERELIVDYFIRGETLASLGEREGCEESTIQRRIKKVLRKIRDSVEG
jgi:RNA polymerase sigma factor (sigma-70 family)